MVCKLYLKNLLGKIDNDDDKKIDDYSEERKTTKKCQKQKLFTILNFGLIFLLSHEFVLRLLNEIRAPFNLRG